MLLVWSSFLMQNIWVNRCSCCQHLTHIQTHKHWGAGPAEHLLCLYYKDRQILRCVCVCGEMGAYLWRKSVVSSLLFMTVCRRTCRFYSLSLCVLYNVDWSVFMIVSELTFGYETSEQFGSCLVCYASSVVYIMLENLPGVTFLLYFPSVLLLKDYWTFT